MSCHAAASETATVLLGRLAACRGYLVERGTEWCLFGDRNAYARPLDRVSAAVVADLVARGHLVARAEGGLEAQDSRRATSGRFADQRPPRPAEEAPAPLVNPAESPLAWLRARKDRNGRPLLSAEQFVAGERLRADYERGCLGARVTANWDVAVSRGSAGGRAEVSDLAIAARQQVHAALDAVGPELSGILLQICCLSAGLEQAERLLDLPQRSGRVVLGLALTGLARHYGLVATGTNGRRSGVHHWAAEGYRPAIPPAAGA